MLERVRGYADAVLETAGSDISQVAGQLETFRSVLNASEDLKSVLSSANIPLASRRAVVDELLSGKALPMVVDLVRYAVQDGAAAEYLADVDGIVVAAAARRDGLEPLIEASGRLATTDRLDGYATAVLAQVDRRHLGDIEDDLFRFGRIAEGNDELRAALTTSELPPASRARIVWDLLSGRATSQAARMASYAALWGRPRDFLVLVEALTERVAREADRRVADVRSAVELSEAEKQRLAAALTRYTGHQVDVRVSTQENLLGGFVAAVGDIVVDASLRHRLEEARELLFAPSVPSTQSFSSPSQSSGVASPFEPAPGVTGTDEPGAGAPVEP